MFSAQFCFGRWYLGRNGRANWQDGERSTPSVNSTQINELMEHSVFATDYFFAFLENKCPSLDSKVDPNENGFNSKTTFKVGTIRILFMEWCHVHSMWDLIGDGKGGFGGIANRYSQSGSNKSLVS